MLNTNNLQAQAVSVCDNGGFEQDFLHYSGETSAYNKGSNSCTPTDVFGVDIVFSSASLPTFRRFEIVSSGIDSLVGIPKTKFGSKALRLNSPYGSGSDSCYGYHGVDRIKKQFTVTEDNRNFTVWYAVVLENPPKHDDQQPFLTIQCDLDPTNELCFDADFLMCEQARADSTCDTIPLDVLTWTCHRFKIPQSEIGNIANLEITVADCGQGAHFGYAYIDGICEECTGSALGTITLDTVINYHSCEGEIATICGSYVLPDICDENWWVKEITVPGYTIYNVEINTTNKTFCFEFPKSNFGSINCLEIYGKIVFTNGAIDLPFQLSNSIEVCKNKFVEYNYSFTTSICFENGTSDNLSDDYYYVYVSLDPTNNKDWTIDRQLYDPYPHETDIHEIADGTGNGNVVLGPFRIQEGDWKMIITIDTCIYEEDITPPAYCSGCNKFYNVDLTDVTCNSSNNNWSFKIKVPGDVTKQYALYKDGIIINNYYYGTTYIIPVGLISTRCCTYELISSLTCKSTFTICPPKPCSVSCNLEVYEKNVICYKNMSVVYFDVQLEVSGPSNKYLCYSTDGGITRNVLPTNQKVGTYTQDVEITIFLCDNQTCTLNCTDCFKTIYVPVPECNALFPVDSKSTESSQLLKIYPNPLFTDELTFESDQSFTEFEIYDAVGNLILKDNFVGKHYKLDFKGSS